MTLLQRILRAVPDDADHGRILDGALAAFLDFGIRRTSMNEVAKRSSLSPATLYRRFAQKSQLVEAVAIREARRFVEAVDRSVDHDASAVEQVVEGFVAFADGLTRNRLLARLLATEPEVTLPLLTTQAGPFLALGRDYLAETITRLQRQGKVAAFDPEPPAEILARLALSLALTPQGIIPVNEPAAARDFAREFITPLLRLDPGAL
ncbi:TetR/AcrR family transcriptional regulator [Amycolatopsis sp. NPDC059657]|uniref:TetR/AcrR family transcriptional regulator n=1 Tax=Amycolatopsis sp. NPDC059657 TaxID=3346899 RepID=UPI003670A812